MWGSEYDWHGRYTSATGKFAVARERGEIENGAQLKVPQVMLHCGIDRWMQGYSSTCADVLTKCVYLLYYIID